MNPLANIPSATTDLAALQRGGVIMAHFTVPTFTTEHVAIADPLTFDLRVGVWPEHVSVDTWAAGAKAITNSEMEGGLATYGFPPPSGPAKKW